MKAIRTKYHGPTNSRGARIIADDGDGNRATIGYPHELSSEDGHRLAAETLQQKMKWPGQLIAGQHGNDHVFVFRDDLDFARIAPASPRVYVRGR